MSDTGLREKFGDRSTPVRAAVAVALLAGFACIAGPAFAQDAKEPAKKEQKAAKPAAAAPAAGKDAAAKDGKDGKEAAAPQGDRAVWAKICQKLPVVKKDKEGKETKEEKEACKTLFESFDQIGRPLVSVSVEQGEGLDKKTLSVIVPPGVALPPGLSLAIFQKEQWDKIAAENKDGKAVKAEDLGLKPFNFKFLHCPDTGCVAITEASDEMLGQMKSGVGMMIRIADVSGKVFDLAVPLKGFNESFTGPAVDTKAFMTDRQARLMANAKRQAAARESFMKERAEMEKAGGAGAAAKGPTTGSTTPAPKADAKPAEKK